MYGDDNNNCIHNHWKLEKTELSITVMDKQIVIHPHNGMLPSHEKEQTPNTSNHMNESQKHDTQ